MKVLEVKSLCKKYPAFLLDNVSFSLEEGRIMGFIGRNGAGKTTTLKSILNIVHPTSGEVRVLGLDGAMSEDEIKQNVGYAGGAVDFYKRKKLKTIVGVTKKFYDNWDDAEYEKYMTLFSLDDNKTPMQLSEGMRVKFSLVLALSHRAKLLILDEPTSGLDPVSREELLETFRFLRDRGVSILFSTHITSDLEKCADDITYIAKGRVIASEELAAFMERCRKDGVGETLDDIMVHFEKESIYEKAAD